MARKAIVSRTIKATKCNVLCVNIPTAETENKEVTVSRTYSDPVKLLKKVQSVVDTDTFKAVQVISSVVVEQRYGMSEEDFIAHSEVLPPLPVTKKDADGNDIDDTDTDEEN